MNESDVREEILAPFLRELGYATGTENDISRETPLTYPRMQLGRKKPKTDPLIRGRADYILQVRDHAQWVLESKPPHEALDVEAINQTWTYANHPEVRAVYFALSNGRELMVFSTTNPPDSQPLLKLKHADFNQAKALLSPDSIRKKFPKASISVTPIAEGFGGIIKIIRGSVRYSEYPGYAPALADMQISIVDGQIERARNGGLVVSIRTQSPSTSIQDLLSNLGLDVIEYETASERISTDARDPTIFHYEGSMQIPEGTELFDMNTLRTIKFEHSVDGSLFSTIYAHIVDQTIKAKIVNQMTFGDPLDISETLSGKIEAMVI